MEQENTEKTEVKLNWKKEAIDGLKDFAKDLFEVLCFLGSLVGLLLVQSDKTGQQILDMFNGPQNFVSIVFIGAFLIIAGLISIPVRWVVKKLLGFVWWLLQFLYFIVWAIVLKIKQG